MISPTCMTRIITLFIMYFGMKSEISHKYLVTAWDRCKNQFVVAFLIRILIE